MSSNLVTLCIWGDHTWCEKEDLEEYLTFMSDDYVVVKMDTDKHSDVEAFVSDYEF